MKVEAGQVWETAGDLYGARKRIHVESVDGGTAMCTTVGSTKPPRPYRAAVLANGRRATILITQADGTPYVKPARRRGPPRNIPEPTASDYRREVKPRSTLSARAREAVRMRMVEGRSNEDVAKQFGVAGSTVANWVTAAKLEGFGS